MSIPEHTPVPAVIFHGSAILTGIVVGLLFVGLVLYPALGIGT